MSQNLRFVSRPAQFALLLACCGASVLGFSEVGFAQATPPSQPPATQPPATQPPAAQPPAAQPPATSDGAKELEALRAELEAARARIAALEAELAAMRAAAAPVTPVPTAPSTPSAPSAPGGEQVEAARRIASIDDFLSKAKAEYATALPTPAPGQPAEPAAARQRSLERYVTAMNRGWRQTVEWKVRVLKSERLNEGVLLTVQQVDDSNGAIGDPFPVGIEARRVRRLESAYMKAAPSDPFVLRAEFTPRLVVDNSRLEPGVFNNPPLIGPAVELRYDLSAESLSPVRQKAGKPSGHGNEKDNDKANPKDGPKEPAAPAQGPTR